MILNYILVGCPWYLRSSQKFGVNWTDLLTSRVRRVHRATISLTLDVVSFRSICYHFTRFLVRSIISFHPTTCSSNQACRKWRDPTVTIRSHCFFFLLEETTQGGRSANGIKDCETVGLFSQNRFINARLRGLHFTARAFSTYMQAKIRNVLQSVVVLTTVFIRISAQPRISAHLE